MNQFSRGRQMLDLSLGHATSSAAASTTLNIDMTPRSPPKMANQGLDGTFVPVQVGQSDIILQVQVITQDALLTYATPVDVPTMETVADSQVEDVALLNIPVADTISVSNVLWPETVVNISTIDAPRSDQAGKH